MDARSLELNTCDKAEIKTRKVRHCIHVHHISLQSYGGEERYSPNPSPRDTAQSYILTRKRILAILSTIKALGNTLWKCFDSYDAIARSEEYKARDNPAEEASR